MFATNPPRAKNSTRTKEFIKRYYPDIDAELWNDWHWQLRNRLRTEADLSRVFELSADEREAISRNGNALPAAITPYYASLMSRSDASDPLRRTMVPSTTEFTRAPGEADDPLGEDNQSPVPGLVHRYPDRVLFLVTGQCAAYCRYCTRSRMVGHGADSCRSSLTRWQQALDYIAATPAVRDVLLSGGDPLTMADDRIEWILSRLRRIPHVEVIRIGTKAPIVLPQRITPKLTRMLKKYHPLWMSIHCTHPDELTPEAEQALSRLADAGIPLGSQTVLLSGINDSVEVMRPFMQKLMRNRVRPYYIYQCDPISGSSHFRTSVAKGLEIIKGLRGHTSGYAVPSYVIDAPGGGGKIPLLPEYCQGHDGTDLVLKNYQDKEYRYPDADA